MLRLNFKPTKALSQVEFILLMAFMMGTVAFTIDAMLPSLPEIAEQLSPDNVNRAQLILTIFVLGMGVGTFFSGPISDSFGRKATLIGGTVIYLAGALISAFAGDLTFLLIGRFIQGIGASSARTVPMALIRDLYSGAQMARIISIIMTFFIVIPAIAPTLGGAIAHVTGWRGLFGAFAVFGVLGVLWLLLRQPETLPPEKRRPFDIKDLIAGAREVLGNHNVRIYTMVLTLGFGQMFAMLATSKQLYLAYGIDETFAYWFGAVALIGGSASILNARIVMRFGMFRIARSAFVMQIIASCVALGMIWADVGYGTAGLVIMFLWNGSVVAIASLSFGNINAMAMQPMGHLAGMTASVLTAISTIVAVAIAAPVGLAFNGTGVPVMLATLACSALAWYLMGRARK